MNIADLRRILKISLLTIPLSLLTFLFFDVFMGIVMGGIRTVIGFPIPYYIDEWNTPGVELDQPYLKVVDIMIFYFGYTALFYLLKYKLGTKSKL